MERSLGKGNRPLDGVGLAKGKTERSLGELERGLGEMDDRRGNWTRGFYKCTESATEWTTWIAQFPDFGCELLHSGGHW
jgi:hypothetical protein